MCEIGKRRQLNEKKRYGAVRDLSFYETRWIAKLSLKNWSAEKNISPLRFNLAHAWGWGSWVGSRTTTGRA